MLVSAFLLTLLLFYFSSASAPHNFPIAPSLNNEFEITLQKPSNTIHSLILLTNPNPLLHYRVILALQSTLTTFTPTKM